MSIHRSNEVTLFSNGIGHFRRNHNIKAGADETISIPFKRDHIGDVAASLQVFGAVRLTTPPSFTPSNANSTALNIDSSEAYLSLLRSLSGASITVTHNGAKSQYTLVGVDATRQFKGEAEVETHYLVVKKGGAIKKLNLCEVSELEFDDESVRTEIEKALKTNFQTIKPDSTLLDITLQATGESDTDAVVQYTIPVAAWKMRYAIRQDKGKFTLEGAAIIDNNTDEDWDNFKVSVVTGNPISFNTDIATVSVPSRKFVRLVEDNLMGNVDVADGYSEYESAGGFESVRARGAVAAPMAAARNLGPKMAFSNTCSFGLAQHAAGEGNLETYYDVAAAAPGVESKEVGDFCVFTSKEPITILARKSAVVPMFTVPLSSAGLVLFYKESNNASRPYRAVKFKNETEYSLGKGKTVIYNEGIFSGECVLDTTKPGENRVLPHCLENGVKIVKDVKSDKSTRSSIRISDGVAIDESVRTTTTQYVIENKKDENFRVALEHSMLIPGPNTMVGFSGVETKDKEKIPSSNSYRVYFELPPKQKVTLTVTETCVNQNSVGLYGRFGWLRGLMTEVGGTLATNAQVLAAVKVQEEIDAVNVQLNNARTTRQELTQQAERVRENLAAAKDTGHATTVADWIKDLDTTEKEIRKIDKQTMPDLNAKLQTLSTKLNEELKKVSLTWKA